VADFFCGGNVYASHDDSQRDFLTEGSYMITSFARRLAALLAFLGAAFSASATSTGADYTDIWWAGQSESGWGVNMIEQGTTIFATFFVYGADQSARWFTATIDSGGGTSFTGPLYQTTGPYYGGAFNSNAVTVTQVGTMTVNFASAYAGSLSYTVNGVTVNKSIVRQSFKNNNLAGTYMGGMAASGSNCHNGVTNGPSFMNGAVVVTQNGQSVSMVVTFYSDAGNLTQCTFNGSLAAQGVLGQIANGSFSCVANVNGVNTASNAGSFNLDNMTMTQSGFHGIFTGSDQYCSYNGWFGGVKAPS